MADWCKCGNPLSGRRLVCDGCKKRKRKYLIDARIRPNSTAVGYGYSHKKARAIAARIVASGVDCARCGKLIDPAEPWDLGHVDGDKSRYSGPEHQKCNRATAGRRRPQSRNW